MSLPALRWQQGGADHSALWRSAAGMPPPQKIVPADDTQNADHAYRLACAGHALLWQGDFQNARQLLQALGRRLERKPRKAPAKQAAHTLTEAFHQHRLKQAQRAAMLNKLLVPLDAGYRIPLRRAPDVAEACSEAYGPAQGPSVVALRELLG
ncbi:MAG: methyltransferase, partial [Methylobacterium sp.]|nr:methyltransferase [Methylobacterium sp.]